jgi:hypothetical protein
LTADLANEYPPLKNYIDFWGERVIKMNIKKILIIQIKVQTIIQSISIASKKVFSLNFTRINFNCVLPSLLKSFQLSFLISLVFCFSLSAQASEEINISCAGDRAKIEGKLIYTKNGVLAGTLEVSGDIFATQIQGEQNFSGRYVFAPAGEFYKDYDYRLVEVITGKHPDSLYLKSVVLRDGQISEKLYYNGAIINVTCGN